MVHVWHIFHPRLPEGREALARIANFLEQQAPRNA
jgi:acetyl esterase/lipase